MRQSTVLHNGTKYGRLDASGLRTLSFVGPLLNQSTAR